MNIKITAISSGGAGIGRVPRHAVPAFGGELNQKVVFIPLTAIGDEVEVRIVKETKSLIYAEVVSIITPSPDRIESDCDVFGICGGCDFRHISYEAELHAKENIIRDAFTRIGKLNPQFLSVIPSENTDYYRNKVQLPVNGNTYGFYAAKSRDIIPHTQCKLYPPYFKEFVIKTIKNNSGNLKNITIRKAHYSGEICVNADRDINEMICGVKLKISSRSFCQVNISTAEKLYELVRIFAEPAGKSILDLYCGIGSIGLSMAHEAREVIGVEIVKEAVKNAQHNAKINGFTNARFHCGDAGIKLDVKPDVVILDPARKGCENSVLERVSELAPPRIVMVSCNPATAARDCSRLAAMEYKVLKVGGVDMFPRTRHVECIALLIK